MPLWHCCGIWVLLVCGWVSHTAWNRGIHEHTNTNTVPPLCCVSLASWLHPFHLRWNALLKQTAPYLVPPNAFLLKNCTVHLIKMSQTWNMLRPQTCTDHRDIQLVEWVGGLSRLGTHNPMNEEIQWIFYNRHLKHSVCFLTPKPRFF